VTTTVTVRVAESHPAAKQAATIAVTAAQQARDIVSGLIVSLQAGARRLGLGEATASVGDDTLQPAMNV
jgi:hypothetical protein